MAQFPVIAAGARDTADIINLALPNYVVKPGDTTRASNVTAANDPDLVTGTLLAAGVYLVEFHVRFGALLAAGLRTQWTVPAGTSGNRDTMGPGSANAAETNGNTTELRWATIPYATAALYTDARNAVASPVHLIEKAIVTIGATAGTVAFSWAQNVTNATGTVVLATSYVRWQQVG